MEEPETERLAEAIETAGTNIEKGLNSLAAAILEAATVYQFVQLYPKKDPVHGELEAQIGKRLEDL